jgi:predicted nucleotidyltransferase
MNLSELIDTLRRIVEFLENQKIDYMVIGGWALPFYGQIRTTIDLDIAISVTESDFEELCNTALDHGYSPYLTAEKNPYCVFMDNISSYEVELWKNPDGVVWDSQTINRRNKVVRLGVEFWIISLEDFIVNKLARVDRSLQDEMDVKSVLEREDVNIDWSYLKYRAENAEVLSQLQAIKDSA